MSIILSVNSNRKNPEVYLVMMSSNGEEEEEEEEKEATGFWSSSESAMRLSLLPAALRRVSPCLVLPCLAPVVFCILRLSCLLIILLQFRSFPPIRPIPLSVIFSLRPPRLSFESLWLLLLLLQSSQLSVCVSLELREMFGIARLHSLKRSVVWTTTNRTKERERPY